LSLKKIKIGRRARGFHFSSKLVSASKEVEGEEESGEKSESSEDSCASKIIGGEGREPLMVPAQREARSDKEFRRAE